MKYNVAKPIGWCRRLGWFAVAAAMALSALPMLGDSLQSLPVTLVANPLPAGQDETTLTWNAPNSTAVQVRVGSPTGTLFADGGPTGSAVTGPWVSLGMSFYLIDATTLQPLASVVVQQPGATLTASPNPLPDGVNQTTLTWTAPNSAAVQIRVGSPTGTLFADGGQSGSVATGPWASPGMSFYLIDAATQQQIASTTIQDPSAPTLGTLTPQDAAYYLTPDAYAFIRPGLTVTITGGSIAADGTMTANFTVTDMLGLPLDINGVTTPGVISARFTAATIPAGQEQYVSYIYTTTTTNGVTTTQAARDTGGVVTPVGSGVGTYTYTYHTKAPATFDPTATQTFGMYATRDLTSFDLGTQYSNSTFNFVPNGSPVTVIRDVVNTASCNQCHDPLSAHGGARQIVPLCVMCHTPQIDGSWQQQHGRLQGDGPQDPHGIELADRARGPAVLFWCLADYREQLLNRGFPIRCPVLHAVSRTRRNSGQLLQDRTHPRCLRIVPRQCELPGELPGGIRSQSCAPTILWLRPTIRSARLVTNRKRRRNLTCRFPEHTRFKPIRRS